MYKGKKILALIPARGGSKGLPGKNARPLLGRPLIAWTIGQARASRLVDEIFVSTDSRAIADISGRWGVAVPYLRPRKLATDASPTIDTVLHTLDWFEGNGKRFDVLALLEPTSPLRAANDIDRGLKLFIDHYSSADSVISLGKVHLENPHVMKTIVKGMVRPLMKPTGTITRRQQCPDAYFPYGVLYAAKAGTLKHERTFYTKRTMPYLIQRWQNYEIDDICDFLCVETMMRERMEEMRCGS